MDTEEAKQVIRDSLESAERSAQRNANNTARSYWMKLGAKKLVEEFNMRTNENVQLKKDGNSITFVGKGGKEMPKEDMINLIVDQNVVRKAQATRIK